jgi:hypothetical protein
VIKWLIGFVGFYGEVLQRFFYIAYMLEKEFRKNKTKRLNVFSNMKNTGEESEHWQMKTKV